jgi:hypothetical protein
MRNWPIRRKLFAIPLVAVLLLMVTAACLFESSLVYEQAVRSAVESASTYPDAAHTAAAAAVEHASHSFFVDRLVLLGTIAVATLMLLVGAWLVISALSRRLRDLQESFAQAVDRGAPPTPDSQTATKSKPCPIACTKRCSAVASAKLSCAAPPNSWNSPRPPAASASSTWISSPATSPAPRCTSNSGSGASRWRLHPRGVVGHHAPRGL